MNRIREWIVPIDEVTESFKADFGKLDTEQLNWKPEANTWSIAQNIDHLMVINRTYFPIVDAIHSNTYKLPWISKLGFVMNFFGKFILKSVNPDRRNKIKTFPMWHPQSSTMESDILQQFERHQAELKDFIMSCKDLLAKKTVISSPANKNIVYKLETALDIIVTHEKRHLQQARELLLVLPKKQL
jgi:hypothetical protein